MENADWLTLCKFRITYGLTGNQNFSPYQAKATYKFYDNIIYDNISGAYLMGMPNPNLKWQQTGDFTVGLDLGICKKLNLRFDYYNSRTRDALIAMSIPASTGFTTYMENLGNVQNRGVEATANWRFYQDGQSYMSLTGSIAHNVNKVTEISDALSSFNREQDAENTTSPIVRYEEGQSMTAIWAVQSLGIDPATGREMFRKKDGTTTYDYTTDDYIIAGDSNPKVHGTFGFNGEYKGIGLSLLFSYQLGGDYYTPITWTAVCSATPGTIRVTWLSTSTSAVRRRPPTPPRALCSVTICSTSRRFRPTTTSSTVHGCSASAWNVCV